MKHVILCIFPLGRKSLFHDVQLIGRRSYVVLTTNMYFSSIFLPKIYFALPVELQLLFVNIDSHVRLMLSGDKWVNSSPSGRNSRHFADDIFRCIPLIKPFFIFIKILLTFVPAGSTGNSPALVLTMARRRTGDKPSSEPMLTRFTDAFVRH